MIDPVQAFLEANSLQTPVFPASSRYHGLGTSVLTTPDGCNVAYLKRRFVPPPERFALLQEHAVVEGDRLDNLAQRYLGDPEQYWRLCDANGALRPDELVETIGRRLRITLPEGIPGVSND
ncbi:LysM domain-containing protein [Crenobacter sp. SG2303]|uniref:LysM domain-containing protein n=1 Tax=Crenobacter oryzisoli TaxID=3056844 RepID=A0ABT7XMR6_9NEIS|nr:LysM domain-containing protein [Crenobacter sp. SG2303]MDN0075088.1 LysM domain-containing protein [Crenobacter sp. SG2303]MDN0076304.1 LysM domain-containing protein [Crenobacter sp. SG2303]